MSTATSSAAGTLVYGRCNPYGAETGGPRRVLGGLYGAASAATPDQGLPDAVAQGEWSCQQPAQVRCRMLCKCSHRGQVMQLCSWHDETNYVGEYTAGVVRQVRQTVRVRGHYEEIQRRQSDSCPRCMFPGDYAALHKEFQQWGNELALIEALGRWRSPRAHMIRQRLSDIGQQFDEGRALGIIHNCPLTLVPVS
jgi:hypothetical protein